MGQNETNGSKRKGEIKVKQPVILVMAAGMGSRYGGLKQMEAVGPGGEAILDYSLYDARRAGFEKAVLILNRRIEGEFREVVGRRIEKQMDVEYAFQELDHLPQGFSAPQGRTKPWGTGHAVLCGKEAVGDAPFVVINADDYYGVQSFEQVYRFLKTTQGSGTYCMAGYRLENTLTENGFVSRGICEINGEGKLQSVTERTRIESGPNGPFYVENGVSTPIAAGTVVSMNFWGFTPDFFAALEAGFSPFLERALAENPEKGEYLLPSVVDSMIHGGRAQVQVMISPDRWYGVTYREDRPTVVAALAAMTEQGLYPQQI